MTRVPDSLSGLSGRARTFAGIVFRAGDLWRPPVSPALENVSQWSVSSETWHAAERFDVEFGGLDIAVLGGPLEGRVVLGVAGMEFMWRNRQGGEMFKCASHATLQCSIVSSVRRQLGCSWSREFTPLFDSVELFVEDSAMWGFVQGWSYAAVGPLSIEVLLEKFPGLVLDDSASGDLCSWWVSPEVVIAAHRYLSAARGENFQIAVLVKTDELKDVVRGILRESDVSDLSIKAGEVYGSVPELHARGE